MGKNKLSQRNSSRRNFLKLLGMVGAGLTVFPEVGISKSIPERNNSGKTILRDLEMPTNSPALKDFTSSYRIFAITDTHLRFGVDKNPYLPGAVGTGSIATRIHYASNSRFRNFIDIVNKENPDFVMHIGDMCDLPSDWHFFTTEWNKVVALKGLTPGNHDLDDYGEDINRLVTLLGYHNEQELGGSKFNKSFAVNKDLRIVILDSTYDSDNRHTPSSRSKVSTKGIGFLEKQLKYCTQKHIVVFSHNIPHYNSYPTESNPYYIKQGSLDAQNAIDRSRTFNPNLQSINWFGGHAHTPSIVSYDSLGPNSIGYRLPDSIEVNENESINNGCTVIEIKPNGDLELSSKSLKYPYK